MSEFSDREKWPTCDLEREAEFTNRETVRLSDRIENMEADLDDMWRLLGEMRAELASRKQ